MVSTGWGNLYRARTNHAGCHTRPKTNAWGGITAALHGDPRVPMVQCSIFDQQYDRALCDLRASINIMPKVIFEQLQYPALSPTMMYVQLADSLIRYPEGEIKNMLVRIKNSFFLADFVILDMEGDLGLQLNLGRPFLRDAKARIDVGIGEIRFRIGTDNIFFKFQYMTEQKFIINQGHDGTTIWASQNPS